MFARYFIELPMDHRLVEQAIVGDPQSWLPGLASRANHHGDALLAQVGFGDHVRVAREVSIEVGQAVHMPSKTLVPIRWKATGAGGLFPSLDADLEIGALGSDRTQVAISARYAPPLGALGRTVDRTVMFRVAEATMKDLLDNVALALTQNARLMSRAADGG
jgi:hypothetical protein